MAAERFLDFNESSRDDPDQSEPKRIKTRPSLSSVIGEALMVKSLQTFSSHLEPVLRRVVVLWSGGKCLVKKTVNEEMERGLRRVARAQPLLHRPSPLQIEGPEVPTLQLCFPKKLSLPVFTRSKIEDDDSNPLQILLLDNQRSPTTLPSPVKVEIVVLDGDFLNDDQNQKDQYWTTEQFDEKIVRERKGKRPLITGDVILTLREGQTSIGALTFTDNSSWIRSRTFRLGARVVTGCSDVKIREAFTEPFVVKDHRGELYKKHHPPALSDEVWRLEKIGKDGAFHKKLQSEGINTVQELLKLWVVEPAKLRAILGTGMSDKMFEITIKHATTCDLGNKHYVLRESSHIIVLNPICQVVGVLLNGKTCGARDLSKAYVQNLVKVAYKKWNSLEEVDGQLNENTLLAPGDLVEATTRCSNDNRNGSRSNQINGLVPYGSHEHAEMQSITSTNYARIQHSGWPPYSSSPDLRIETGNGFSISDSHLEDDSIALRALWSLGT